MYQDINKFAVKCFFISFMLIAITGVALSITTQAAYVTLGGAFIFSLLGCGTVVLKQLGFIDESL